MVVERKQRLVRALYHVPDFCSVVPNMEQVPFWFVDQILHCSKHFEWILNGTSLSVKAIWSKKKNQELLSVLRKRHLNL